MQWPRRKNQTRIGEKSPRLASTIGITVKARPAAGSHRGPLDPGACNGMVGMVAARRRDQHFHVRRHSPKGTEPAASWT
jgi:hypothetical protein